jgi:hypothetical protein
MIKLVTRSKGLTVMSLPITVYRAKFEYREKRHPVLTVRFRIGRKRKK